MRKQHEPVAWTFTRTSGVDLNPTTLVQRANHFASKLKGFTTVTLLLRREGSAMRGYLLTTGNRGDSMRTATDLAHAVGAQAQAVEVPEHLGWIAQGLNPGDDLPEDAAPAVVGHLVYLNDSAVARDVQVGADPSEMARLMANSMPDGCWVAITLRAPDRVEGKRWNAWLSHRMSTALPTHHSLAADSVIASVYAGAEDAATVEALLESTRSAMPGFDLIVRTKVATRPRALLPWVPAGLGLIALFVIAHLAGLPGSPTSHLAATIAGWAGRLLMAGLVAGIVSTLVGVGRFLGFLPAAWKRWHHDLTHGIFPAPPRRRRKPRAPRKAISTATKEQEEFEGDYPLHPAAFKIGPHLVTGLVSPHGSAASGVVSTQARAIPPAVLEPIGPVLARTTDASGQGEKSVHLSAPDLSGGVAITGLAGSGKSALTHALFAWASLQRSIARRIGDDRSRHDAHDPQGTGPVAAGHYPGTHLGSGTALVAFESKGDGVPEYQAWAAAVGDQTQVVDLIDETTPAIDVFAVEGNVFDRANFVVNALKYAFGDGAIQDRSFETLLSLIPAALKVTPEIAGAVRGLAVDGSPMYYTHVLLGGRGDDLAADLAGELAAEASRPDADPELVDVVALYSHLYGPKVTPAQRRALVEAPRNKMRQLLELEQWWSPKRPKITWSQVLNEYRSVVVATGTSHHGRMVEDELNAQMSALLMYSLRHAILRTCQGWQAQGKAVAIFSDELSLLAGSSEQVIAWLKDQGRAFGVIPVLATQRPEQLSDKVRSAFKNFSTLISFAQGDMGTAREIAEAVSGGDGDMWTSDDIKQLDTYVAVVRATVGKKWQPAFIVKVHNFAADRAGFAAFQGFGSLPAALPAAAPTHVGPAAAEPGEAHDQTYGDPASVSSTAAASGTHFAPIWADDVPVLDGDGF